tara:strand:- start:125 stop:517 length:393 start_codon:yes stop_codon:yes gene_type:complete
MGASGAGASGSDAGFQNSVETRNKKANEKNLGTSDYQGDLDSRNSDKRNNNNNIGGNGGNGGQGTNILIAPTVAEVSQSNAANATTPVEEDPLYLRKKKTQARGRSTTILTSSKGVDEGLTLGKKSLLGS